MMTYRVLFVVFIFLFAGCGSENKKNNRDINITGTEIIEKIPKKVTVYIHGYDKDGYKKRAVYGDISTDIVIDSLVEFTDLPTMYNFDKENFTNIITMTEYYGDEAPAYYTQQDIDDIKEITNIHNGGIPRYATIVAKFIKHVMDESGADEINIVSASMGSLVTRWLIEKDVEQLASNKKIKKWLSIEGVIRGNYAASNSILMGIIDPFEKQYIDTKHMDYSWINKNLATASHSNYKDIIMGFIGSTHDKDGYLDVLLTINGQLQANDGVQLLKDTRFFSTPNHTPTYTNFYQDHLGIKKDRGAWAGVATFISSKKHIKITLLNAKVEDLHESIYFLNKRAEIVFESRVFSSKIYEQFGVEDAISERIVEGGALKMVKYSKKGQNKFVGQSIFNDFVLEDEEELSLIIEGYELDKFAIYGVREPSFESSKSSLGKIEIDIPLKEGIYEVIGKDWSGEINVEII